MELFKSIIEKVKINRKSSNIVEPDVNEQNYIVFNAVDIRGNVATAKYKIIEIKIKGKSVLVLAEKSNLTALPNFNECVLNKIDKEKCVFNFDCLNKITYIESGVGDIFNNFPVGILNVLLNPTDEEVSKNLEDIGKELLNHFQATTESFLDMLRE